MARHRVVAWLIASIALLSVSAQGATITEFLNTNTVGQAASTDTTSLYAQVTNANYGVASTWSQDGPFTVFAPNNPAFSDSLVAPKIADLVSSAATDPSGIQKLLNGHIVYGKYASSDLTDGLALQTISGETLTVYKTSSGAIYVANMLVKNADNDVTNNGVNSYVNIVDAVNFPPSSTTPTTVSVAYSFGNSRQSSMHLHTHTTYALFLY